MKIKILFFVFLTFSVCFSNENIEIPVRAVSNSFINLHLRIPEFNVSTQATGSIKGYREGKIIIPFKEQNQKKKLKIKFFYHITRGGEWIGRIKGEFEINSDFHRFPHRLLLLSQKEKDISKYSFFSFSLNKVFFRKGEKGYLRIQKVDKSNMLFTCYLKNIFPFSTENYWFSLPLKKESENIYSFIIPPLPNSVYKMKIVCAEKGELNPDTNPYGDFIIGISTHNPNITIFTDRNRTVFLQGEKAELNVFVEGSDFYKGKIKIFLDNKFLKELDISSDRYSTFSFILDTSRISLGRYILKAVISTGAEATYPITIVSPVLQTHLVMLDYHFFSKLISPLSSGISLPTIIKSESNYVNALTEGGGSYEFLDELYHRRKGGDIFKESRYREIKNFIKKYSLYLPFERTYNPAKREQILELCLKDKISHFIRPSFVRYLAHSIPEDENRRYRHIQIFAQTYRNYPSFTGINYHDDSYALGYGETGWMDGRRKERMEALKNRFK
ncbi:hypothetical protein J7L87_03585, partial [bacterium]|nr:hypothetical protein [bacterium]